MTTALKEDQENVRVEDYPKINYARWLEVRLLSISGIAPQRQEFSVHCTYSVARPDLIKFKGPLQFMAGERLSRICHLSINN